MIAYILALMSLIHPKAPMTYDAEVVARSIDAVVASDPLPDGWTKEQTAAVMTVMAWHESRFKMSAVGDTGRAMCAFQVWGSYALTKDPMACTKAALSRIKSSAEKCPDAPLAIYAGGSCGNPAARKISAKRMAKAERLQSQIGVVRE